MDLYCRKTNGKNYAEGTSSIKEAAFPFPARTETILEDEEIADDREVEMPESLRGQESAFVHEIASLQARLHKATAQLEQANKDCVKQALEIGSLATDRKEDLTNVRNLERENAALKRKVESLEPGVGQAKLPRPGPSLKPFEELTPRQQKVASSKLQSQVNKTSEERKIHPVKLSAYLTFR